MKPSVQIDVGARIRELRVASGMSQERFAAAANIDRGYYGLLERGQVNPALVTLARICVALGVPLVQLFDGIALDEEEVRALPRSARGRRVYGDEE